MATTRIESDEQLAVTAALAGAAVVREMFGAPLERFDKSATDFATTADLAAERAVLDVPRAARPDDAVTVGGLLVAADHETHAALLDMARDQAGENTR